MSRQPGVRPSSGFTFIELMLVVTLIAVMVAIAMPYYRDLGNRVKNSDCTHDIVGLEARIETYRITHATLPDTLAEMNLDMVDRWGRPYVFYNIEANGKGHARKDHALNPLNTDYDLYSLGADGVTQSQITNKDSLDDIIRATNGGYVGVASGF
ncbi:MAG: prepilin-type N-terminal cleavage/methylation domain-containing protein [Betaproteobacteria bacterium]